MTRSERRWPWSLPRWSKPSEVRVTAADLDRLGAELCEFAYDLWSRKYDKVYIINWANWLMDDAYRPMLTRWLASLGLKVEPRP